MTGGKERSSNHFMFIVLKLISFSGAIGKFPGSYVKVEVKSRKEQFKEDMVQI
jgi:hypothetical protein